MASKQQRRESAGVLRKPIHDVYDAIKKLQNGAGGTVTVTPQPGVDIGDVTVNNTNTAPVPVALTENGTNTLVKVADDANKAVRVNIVAGGGSGGTSAVDDAAFTVASGTGTPMMGIVTSDSVDSGDAGVIAILANRQQKVTLYDSAGVELAVGGGTQYTEDAAAAANPVGNAQILVRKDTPADEVTTDGDNIARRGTKYGAAYAQIVTSAGAYVDTFGGGTQYTEDVASVADPVGTQLIARRRDSLASETTTDGDNTAVNATSKGELYVKQTDAVPVTDNAGSLTVDNPILSVVGGGAEATAQRVTIASDSTGVLSVDDNGGNLSIDDGGNSITVDNTVLSVVGSGTEATAQRVTIATDSTGVLSVDDNGSTLSVDDGAGSLTVDNAVLSVVGGGTEATAQRVTIASDSTGVLSVDDNGGNLSIDDGGNSITVDNATISVVGGGTEATAQRVTIASDSTGVLSVDDNGASLTVDGAVTATPVGNTTATLSNVAASATSVTLLASNANRRGAIIYSDSTVNLYVKFGTTASTTSFTHLLRGGSMYEIPFSYTGRIDGIWASASGDARITEITA